MPETIARKAQHKRTALLKAVLNEVAHLGQEYLAGRLDPESEADFLAVVDDWGTGEAWRRIKAAQPQRRGGTA